MKEPGSNFGLREEARPPCEVNFVLDQSLPLATRLRDFLRVLAGSSLQLRSLLASLSAGLTQAPSGAATDL